jgi:hypothetical protein
MCLMSKVQFPNRLPHRFHRRLAHCGIESAEQRVGPKASNQTGPEAVSEKVELDIRILAPALAVFAVDNFGFRRMHLQAALREASLKFSLESLCFVLTPTVD